jgi:hypothetical protein
VDPYGRRSPASCSGVCFGVTSIPHVVTRRHREEGQSIKAQSGRRVAAHNVMSESGQIAGESPFAAADFQCSLSGRRNSVA